MSRDTAPYGWKHADEAHSHAYLLPRLLEALDERFPRVQGRRLRLVDLGCGNGFISSRLASLGHEIIGIDASSDGIVVARKAHPELRFEIASVYDDDLASLVGGPVDAVISLEVIEHLYYPKRLFEQSHRMLRQGGSLLLSTPYHGYFKNLALSLLDLWDPHFGVGWDGGHIKFFSVKSATAMAREAGFHRIESDGVGRFPWLWKSMFLFCEK